MSASFFCPLRKNLAPNLEGLVDCAAATLLPNVPTVTEAGYPEINVVAWYGYAVPRGVPQPVVDKIVAGFSDRLRAPNVRPLEKQALQTIEPMTASQLAELYATDTEKYA